MAKYIFPLSVLIFTITLFHITGCSKKEILQEKEKSGCPIDTTKLVDKDWYIFSPAEDASSDRCRWSSDGYWYGASVIPCGPYTFLDCNTFSYDAPGEGPNGVYKIHALTDNYLKMEIINASSYLEVPGRVYELDLNPH